MEPLTVDIYCNLLPVTTHCKELKSMSTLNKIKILLFVTNFSSTTNKHKGFFAFLQHLKKSADFFSDALQQQHPQPRKADDGSRELQTVFRRASARCSSSIAAFVEAKEASNSRTLQLIPVGFFSAFRFSSNIFPVTTNFDDATERCFAGF